MINELKNWWLSVPKNQKTGLIVLASFIGLVFIMAFGVIIGSSIGKAL
ncbi:hypothetical protein Q4506_14260 [Colwellia sp. 4_MG-2023]|jgi:hypothetical protein|nr:MULTISPECIES: hypothetical protein [unclassified Colwellia]MBU2923448.1 hypothetical protein [Colwellia sp. C2M11]MDO6508128.1 hypothetical protein [Colwellia sp. 5_MG-2023]MDO6556848.1 hypothetical protein [Colwellia sp. 4_MG-2023]MDO6653808.1 hypothetical protein [Colwellia sp. 3_MG-2023]MDO6666680.1 hypothetical protein [Colwellia sp. 2_MG-2023]